MKKAKLLEILLFCLIIRDFGGIKGDLCSILLHFLIFAEILNNFSKNMIDLFLTNNGYATMANLKKIKVYTSEINLTTNINSPPGKNEADGESILLPTSIPLRGKMRLLGGINLATNM